MAGMPDPKNQLNPLMQATMEGGYYQPSPLRPPVRNDQSYPNTPDYQRFQSPERKASGFFGELGTPQEAVTEWSMGGVSPAPGRRPPTGQGFTYPALAPGMTRQQVKDVVNFASGATEAPAPFSPMPRIEQNALSSAQDRMSRGLSPFWNPQQDYLFKGML